jgi:hypothetical protein
MIIVITLDAVIAVACIGQATWLAVLLLHNRGQFWRPSEADVSNTAVQNSYAVTPEVSVRSQP